MIKDKGVLKKAIVAAFPNTIPVMAGFFVLGLSYGIYMSTKGFSFVYPMLMSIIIFGGSLQFVTTTMLLAPFAPISCFIMAFLIQVRHIFYGISMLEKYKGTGIKKFYLIFAMCDESFSVSYASKIPKGVDQGWYMFFVNALIQLYWVFSSTLGGILGSYLKINLKGIDFCMTAMFVVILIDQIKQESKPYTAIIGILCSVACLLIFGADSFLLPTMGSVLLILTIFKKPISRGYEL